VGAGVCGLTCAHDLALLGLLGRSLRVGAGSRGECSTWAFPTSRLPREIIKMEVDNILAMGVTLHTRVTLGRDISFGDLRSKFTPYCWPPGSTKAAN